MSKITLKTEPFKVMVGERGTDHMLGKLQKGTKVGDTMVVNSVLDGPTRKAHPIGGHVMFPNYVQAWGRRVIKGKDPDKTPRVEVHDREYVGEVEWLSYGDPKGYIIYARYLKGQASLDYQYQITRMGLETIKEDIDHGYLKMSFGENEIFPTNDQAWAAMIQIHYLNQDSLCRHPEAVGYFWKEVKPLDTTKAEVQEIDESFAAVEIVKNNAGSFRQLEVLKNIVEQRVRIDYDKSKETNLYEVIILHAKNEPRDILEAVNTYKRNVSELLSKFESYEALEVTNKMLVAVKPKHQVILEGVPVKAADVNDWMFTNCMKPEIYEALEKMADISKNFK